MNEKIKPISPDEIIESLKTKIPSAVIESVNALLSENYKGIPITLEKEDIVNHILATSPIIEQQIYDNNWLDFEKIYRDEGWNVKFCSPGVIDTFKSYFLFSKKDK